MASGSRVPHQQVEHTAAPTKASQSFKKSLANGEPSTQGQRVVARNSTTGLLAQWLPLPPCPRGRLKFADSGQSATRRSVLRQLVQNKD
jgi:hypothetical protein